MTVKITGAKLNGLSILEAFAAVALISLVPIWVTAVSADAIVIGCIRLMIAWGGIGLWFFFFGRWPQLNARQWFGLAVIGFLFGAHWLTYFISIKLSTPSMGAIGLSSYGIHLTLLSWWYYKIAPSKTVCFALMLALLGNVIVTSEHGVAGSIFLGFLVGILSGFFYAMLPLMHKKHADISSSFRTFCQFGFALVLFSLLAPLGNWHFPREDWLYLLLMGFVCTLVGHALWVRASTHLNTELTSCIFYLGLPCTILFEQLLTEAELSLRVILGALCIVVANLMTIFGRKALKA